MNKQKETWQPPYKEGNIGCDEYLWLGEDESWEARTPVHVEANVDVKNDTCELVSVTPFHSGKVGEMVKYDDCILKSLSDEQIQELLEFKKLMELKLEGLESKLEIERIKNGEK